MDVDELYQDVIIDHYKNPRCQGRLDKSDASSALRNPLCGDKIEISLAVEDGVVTGIGFEGKGCSISLASASLMSELCVGKSIKEIRGLSGVFESMLLERKDDPDLVQLGDAQALKGVCAFPARYRCALLGWEALERCIAQVESEQADSEPSGTSS